MAEFKKTMTRTGFAYFLILGGATVLQMGFVNIAAFVFPALTDNYIFLSLVTALPIYILALVAYLAIIRKMPAAVNADTRKISVGRFLLLLIFCLGMMYFLNIVSNYITYFIAFLKGRAVINPLQEGVEMGGIAFNVLYSCIAAPIFEEIIFRKMLWRAVGRYGERIFVVTSAVIFGAFHGNLSQLLYAAAIGAVLAMIYSRTGKLRYCIFMHMALNFIGSLIVPTLMTSGGTYAPAMIYGLIVLTILYTGITLALYGRNIHLRDNGEELPERALRCEFSSVGMVIYLLCALTLTTIMTVV